MEVSTAAAEAREVPSFLEVTGSLAADESSDIAPEVSGQVVATPVDVGAVVGGRTPDGRCRVRVGDSELFASGGHTSARGDVKVVVRPERVRVEAPRRSGENRLPGRIGRVVYAGAVSQLVVDLARGVPIQCMLANDGADAALDRGTPVSVHLPCEALRVLPTETTATDEDREKEPSAIPARGMAD